MHAQKFSEEQHSTAALQLLWALLPLSSSFECKLSSLKISVSLSLEMLLPLAAKMSFMVHDYVQKTNAWTTCSILS